MNGQSIFTREVRAADIKQGDEVVAEFICHTMLEEGECQDCEEVGLFQTPPFVVAVPVRVVEDFPGFRRAVIESDDGTWYSTRDFTFWAEAS